MPKFLVRCKETQLYYTEYTAYADNDTHAENLVCEGVGNLRAEMYDSTKHRDVLSVEEIEVKDNEV